MADSPQTPVDTTENVATPQDLGYTNGDLQNNTLKEIATNKEEPKVEPKEEVKEDVIEPKVDVEAKVLELETKVDELTRPKEEVVEEKEPTETEKEYLDWEKKFSLDNNRPPTYLEAMSFVKNQAVSEIEANQLEKQKEQEKEQDRVRQEVQERDKQLSAIVEDELGDLYKAEKLTKVVDPNNPSDPGVIERNALFTTWINVNNERRSKGLPEIASATRIYDFYFTKPSTQPAGADAPVAGNRGSATPPSDDQQLDYSKDVAGKPWSFFKRK